MSVIQLYTLCALSGAALAFWRAPQLPRYNLLLVIAAVPQLGALYGIRISGMFLVSVLAVGIWCVANCAVAGIPATALGVAMNLLVMALHGGAMPIYVETLAQVGVVAAPGALLPGSKDIVVQTALLGLLADWLVLRVGASTFVASPGDLVVVIGLLWWLLLSRPAERVDSMLMFRAAVPPDSRVRLIPGVSARPALTRLALLAAANPSVAESLLHNPADTVAVHPHYVFALDAHDQATLDDIRARSSTVGEFLLGLADVVDGAAC